MAKQQKDILDRFIAGLSLRAILLHPTTMFVFATAIMIGGAIFLWERHQDKIINLDEFRLTEEKIRLTPPPEWAETDLKKLVIGDADGEIASILDSKLVSRTARVMRKVGFVERVRSIEKSKTGLDIDVVYRNPVALVELSSITLVDKWPVENQGKTVLLPVDRNGFLMPESIGQGKILPWITVPYPATFSTTWTEWQDDRIRDASAICALFPVSLYEIGIQRITTNRVCRPESTFNEAPFELYSGSGTRIIWGNPPTQESNNEATPESKIRAIQAIVSQFGRLDKVDLGRIDVRTGKAISTRPSKTAANQKEFFSDLK